jgi:uncharacterized protein YjbI with pentapeptide repeats
MAGRPKGRGGPSAAASAAKALQPPKVSHYLERVELHELLQRESWSEVESNGDLSAVGRTVGITASRFAGALFTEAVLDGSRIVDSVFEDCELSGVHLTEASLTRVLFRNCRMSGVQLGMARLRDVQFIDCKLDGANLRMVSGERVQAERCMLAEADFYAASVNRLVLEHCELRGADFSQLRCTGITLGGSNLEALVGAISLTSATIDAAQVLPLAYSLFGALGITIGDIDDTPTS